MTHATKFKMDHGAITMPFCIATTCDPYHASIRSGLSPSLGLVKVMINIYDIFEDLIFHYNDMKKTNKYKIGSLGVVQSCQTMGVVVC